MTRATSVRHIDVPDRCAEVPDAAAPMAAAADRQVDTAPHLQRGNAGVLDPHFQPPTQIEGVGAVRLI